MLQTIDRIQIVTDDAREAASGWQTLLGAEMHSQDTLRVLGARRTTFRLGRGAVDFLEPDGTGIVADALRARRRAHLFAGGVSTDRFEELLARLAKAGVEPTVEHGQAFVDARPALGAPFPLVISPSADVSPVGLIDSLYEVTWLVDRAEQRVESMAQLFGLDARRFCPISSERFGYSGVLTLFDPDRLHRFEVITPTSETQTMGRFFARNGASFYMCFAETADMVEIERRVAQAGAGVTVDRPAGRYAALAADQMWIHPPALGGVMLGLSRPTMAWTWSGRPERVAEIQ